MLSSMTIKHLCIFLLCGLLQTYVTRFVFVHFIRSELKEVESNQISNFGEDKVFFCHVGIHTNELEDKCTNSNCSLGVFSPEVLRH